MTKWEYIGITLTNRLLGNNKEITVLGDHGWELVNVDQGIAYFRRQKQENIPVKLGPQEIKEAPYV